MNWGFEPEYRLPQIAISESEQSKLVGLYANTAVQGEEQGVEQIKFEEGDE